MRKLCEVDGCENISVAKNCCNKHYARLRRYGDPKGGFFTNKPKPITICLAKHCDTPSRALGLCSKHYMRHRKYGDVDTVSKPGPQPTTGYINKQGYKVVCLPEEFRDGTESKNPRTFEHRVVMMEHLGRPLYPEETVHHINGDKLDNRIENLELWSSNHPSGQRVEDLIAFADEIYKKYKE